MSSPPTSSPIPIYFQNMSPVPPEPTASAVPPGVPVRSKSTEGARSSEETHAALPEPLLRLELRNLRHPSTSTFLSNVDPTVDIAKLVETVVKLLYYPSHRHDTTPTQTSTSTRPQPYQPHIPGTRSITIVPRDMDGVAYTTGLELDDDHKEIHLSLSYITHVRESNKSDAAKIRHELMGVLCHELVHCYQYNGEGHAPGGLIEGIADYVRLKAGYVPPHWKREAGGKVHWDAGYQTTGYFLDWVERSYGEGSVRRINEALRRTKYEEVKFWKGMFGTTVQELWEGYTKEVKASES